MTKPLELQVSRTIAIQELQNMPVRESWANGGYIPKASAWREGTPQKIGNNLRRVLDSDHGALRIYATMPAGLLRREQAFGRFTGLTFNRMLSGGPLEAAQVEEVTDVQLRRGILPVLHLMELSNKPDRRDLVMSVPDLAHYVQNEEATIDLTLDF